MTPPPSPGDIPRRSARPDHIPRRSARPGSPALSPTPRTTLRRKRDRQGADRAVLEAILDEALVAHLGVVDPEGAPLVLPTLHARVGDVVYVHGSTGAASLHTDGADGADGAGGAVGPGGTREVCLTVTLLDGLVLARRVFAHSANYRSAVIRGRARRVTDPEEQLRALEALVEHLTPGQWEHAHRPDRRELAATAVLALDLTEAGVKTRQGPPGDPEVVAEGDRRWAGVVGVRTVFTGPEPCPALGDDVEVPRHVRRWTGRDTAKRKTGARQAEA